MIDFVFRYDPSQPDGKQAPDTAEGARRALVEGNRVFSRWLATCRGEDLDPAPAGSQHVVRCTGLDFATLRPDNGYPAQTPFAVVLGCSDARVPTEMLFGQGFNDIFVVRVAGNVLGDEVQGTIDFAITALRESVRVLVVLGHTNCGAIKGAVDAYLNPAGFWSRGNSPDLRLIFQRIFVAIRGADKALRESWGPDAPNRPGYRGTLIDMAVCLNAAHSAFALRQKVEAVASWDIDVLYGVYDVRTHQVCMPIHPGEPPDAEHVHLAVAPAHPREFEALAAEMAASFRPRIPTGPACLAAEDR